MDKKILKSILRYDFWAANSNQLVAQLFDSEIQELYEVIVDSHKKYEIDIPTDALLALWKDKNPVATRAETGVIEQLINEIEAEDELPDELTSDIIKGLWQRLIGKKIGQLGLNIAEGQEEAFAKLQQLLLDVSNGFMPDDFPDPITDDVAELLELTSNEHRFPLNLRQVQDKLYGPAPGDFWIVHARPETGKTAFSVSLAASPSGFCEKGARVLYLGNEEDPRRTKLRAIQCYSGMTKQEVINNPKQAQDTYSLIAPRMIIQACHTWDLSRVDGYINKIKPDIVMIDQLDKINIDGTYASTHEKLRELYTQTRGLAYKHQVGMFGISQTSNDGEGKTVITADMMENSKTGKYAEADVIIGIGKFPIDPNGNEDPIRFLTISKNKVSGWHGTIPTKLMGEISRYVD